MESSQLTLFLEVQVDPQLMMTLVDLAIEAMLDNVNWKVVAIRESMVVVEILVETQTTYHHQVVTAVAVVVAEEVVAVRESTLVA